MPERIPFMLLPGTVLFPNTILPLYIFEDKYKKMLADCLDGDRIFGVTMVKDGIDSVKKESDMHDIAGAGLIRACVGNSDGTLSLVLHGLGRFKVSMWDHSCSYWRGTIQPLESVVYDSEPLHDRETAVLSICADLQSHGVNLLPRIKQYEVGESDPAVLADIIGAAVARSSGERQKLLEELDVAKRLDIVYSILEGILDE